MLYLIFTTSLLNRYEAKEKNSENRVREYVSALRETWQVLHTVLKEHSDRIRMILVENNNQQGVFEAHFTEEEKARLSIMYTENNAVVYRNKGVAECMDLHEVIHRSFVSDTDIILKLTGRYRMISDQLVRHVLRTESMYDAWMKFYNVDQERYEDTDCVLGCFAIRALYLRLYAPRRLELYDVPELAWSRYIRLQVPRIDSVQDLGVECHFARNGRRVRV